MEFKIKNFKNLLVRFLTRDNYYICEVCQKIHKRDGEEIRLEYAHGRKTHYLWYKSVSMECFITQQIKSKLEQ